MSPADFHPDISVLSFCIFVVVGIKCRDFMPAGQSVIMNYIPSFELQFLNSALRYPNVSHLLSLKINELLDISDHTWENLHMYCFSY